MAHDGTSDPEQAPDRTGDAPAGVIDPTDGKPAAVVAQTETGQDAGQNADALPAWVGLDVETILEGDDVDISEFKAKLKAELKEELLAEIKGELEGALNADDGTSQPVEKTTPGSLFEAKERAGGSSAASTGDSAESSGSAESAESAEPETPAAAEAVEAESEGAAPTESPAEDQDADDTSEESADDTAEPEAKPAHEEEKPAEKKPASSSEPPPDIDFSGSL